MLTIATLHYKGGVGGTLLAMNLAGEACRRGYKARVLDYAHNKCALDWKNQRESEWPEIQLPVVNPLIEIRRAEQDGIDVLIFDTDRKSAATAQDADIVVVPGRATGTHETGPLFECVEVVVGSRVPVLPVLNKVENPDDERVQFAMATLDNSPLATLPAMIVGRSREMDEAEDHWKAVQEMYPDSQAADEIRALFDTLIARSSRD
ncbi:hypothetical protein FGK63_20210 [Ruegeria sediminis]|uniref:ParA family protein n=1 Tax=Ruegeria sediminis TaxID=2583820 RepID=A0ABY2WSW7_9RHOB|nr:hypothetical protein [Ruegeria sediminis]TMV02556.1 hypothetical protein FGK63_20210 [Ruegeria sediminis]